MIALRSLRIRGGAALCCALLAACTAGRARAPGELLLASEMIEVPYPPPVARVEAIPEKHTPEQVWLDGQWAWEGELWRWHDGAWTTPPPGAYFTPWATRRRADGQLLFARAEWRDRSGRPIGADVDGQVCAPPAPLVEAVGR
jgi:hypothetical protein